MVPIATVATVYEIRTDVFVAACVKRGYYFLPRKGKGQGWPNLTLGSLVTVYHGGGLNPEVFTYEELKPCHEADTSP